MFYHLSILLVGISSRQWNDTTFPHACKGVFENFFMNFYARDAE